MAAAHLLVHSGRSMIVNVISSWVVKQSNESAGIQRGCGLVSPTVSSLVGESLTCPSDVSKLTGYCT